MTGPTRREPTPVPRRDPTPVPPVMTPALRRPVFARPLSWRNPWTLLLAVLAAFQAGVIVTLVCTSNRSTLGAVELAPPPAPSLARTPTNAPPANPPPAVAPPANTPPANTPPANTPPTVAPPANPPPANPPPANPPPTNGGHRRPHPPATPSGTPPNPPAIDAGVGDDGLIEVEVTSNPEGATVRIAGAVWGETPLTTFLPAKGPVTVYVELDGYAPARLVWSPGGRRTLHANLKPTEGP